MIFPIVGPINQSWEDHRESPVQGAAGLVLPGLSNKHNWGPTQYRKQLGWMDLYSIYSRFRVPYLNRFPFLKLHAASGSEGMKHLETRRNASETPGTSSHPPKKHSFIDLGKL